MRLAVIVPVLNEAAAIEHTLNALQSLRMRGAKVIVVDGGSDDETIARAAPLVDHVLQSPRGRAQQMNAGAAVALDKERADTLLFLHADTRLPDDADRAIGAALTDPRVLWGRFDVRIEGRSHSLAVVAAMMNWRSRLTGICTGDQAIFMRASLFARLDGFAHIALMEDVDFSRRARRLNRPAAIRQTVVTSGRRWETRGVARTVVQMWALRLAYFLGADPARLARRYRQVR